MTYVSESFRLHSGTDPASVIGKTLWEDGTREAISHTWQAHRETLAAHESFRNFEYMRRMPDGRILYGSLSGEPMFDSSGHFTGYRGVGVRQTARKEAQNALQERDRRLRTIFDTEPECVQVISPEGRLEDMNAAGLKMAEAASLEAVCGMPAIELVAPAHKAAFESLHRQVIGGQAATLEYEMVGLNGGRRWMQTHASPLLDGAGRVTSHLSISRDITAAREAEETRRKLQAELNQSQKMEALGTLAGGIAHDFNNLLSVILGFAQLAKQDAANGASRLEGLSEIEKAAQRARALVRQILTFSRPQPRELEPVRLDQVAEDTLVPLRASLPARIQLSTDFAADLPRIEADANQLGQVLMNLCTNAMHAIGEQSGRIGLSIAVEDGSHAITPDRHKPGRYVHLSVSDTGCGMDAATLERVFDPFFTTKPPGVGTGLGLSVVSGIVRSHGGVISVSSQPGAGSRFDIRFPVKQEATESTHLVQPASGVRGARENILYLDDEQPMASLGQRLLEDMNYRVRAFTSPSEALRAFAENPTDFDLVVTDFNMPAISGIEVAQRLRRLRPDIPVILASGHVTDAVKASAGEAGIGEILYKPFGVEELAAAVQRVLHSAPVTG